MSKQYVNLINKLNEDSDAITREIKQSENKVTDWVQRNADRFYYNFSHMNNGQGIDFAQVIAVAEKNPNKSLDEILDELR